MFIQHRFSKHCTRAKPFDFFLICSLLCRSLLKGCISPLLRNKQAQGQQEWEVGSTFQAAPPLSNRKCHQTKPCRLPSPAGTSRKCPASRSPHAAWEAAGQGAQHDVEPHLLSFAVARSKTEGSNSRPWSRAACPGAHGKAGGLCASPSLQLPG